MHSGQVALAPTGASGPKLCLGVDCDEPLAKAGKKPRPGKLFCSSACRGSAWKVRTFGKTATVSNTDFGTLRELVDRVVKEHRFRHPEHVIAGYVLRHLSPVGPVDFPEPGRPTKRAPDRNGVWHMSAEAFYAIEPFEFPRVPVVADYEIVLRDQNGNLHRTLSYIRIYVAFPSVRLYDGKFHYDYKGRIIWANDAPRVKPRRKRQRRRSEDVTPSQTEQAPAVSNTPPAPPLVLQGLATAPVPPWQGKPVLVETTPTSKLEARLDKLEQELLRERAERAEERRQHEQQRARQSMEIRALRAEVAALEDRNLRLAGSMARNSRTVGTVPMSGLGAVASAPFPPIGMARQDEASSSFTASVSSGNSGGMMHPSAPLAEARPDEPPTFFPLSTREGNSAVATTPAPLVEMAGVFEPSSSSSAPGVDSLGETTEPSEPSEPTPPQIAETRAPPAPKSDPPRPGWKSGGKSKQRGKPTLPKKPPDGPLFGLAADNWRTSHRIR